MEAEEVKAVIDCCDPEEDEDGCIPYESTCFENTLSTSQLTTLSSLQVSYKSFVRDPMLIFSNPSNCL